MLRVEAQQKMFDNVLFVDHLVVGGDLEEDVLGYLFDLLLDYEWFERIQKE